MWAILGWVAGRSLAATCRDAAEWLPGAADKVDLLRVLKCTAASVASWYGLEVELCHIALLPERGDSILYYASALNMRKILPPMSSALLSAVQLGLARIPDEWQLRCFECLRPHPQQTVTASS